MPSPPCWTAKRLLWSRRRSRETFRRFLSAARRQGGRFFLSGGLLNLFLTCGQRSPNTPLLHYAASVVLPKGKRRREMRLCLSMHLHGSRSCRLGRRDATFCRRVCLPCLCQRCGRASPPAPPATRRRATAPQKLPAHGRAPRRAPRWAADSQHCPHPAPSGAHRSPLGRSASPATPG